MPLCDAYIPQGALSPSAERELLAKITDVLLKHEGIDPTNERARPLAWVFVHRSEVYVAGAPPKSPRYRFICQVPAGQYNDERRSAVTAAMTRAVVEAEGGAWPNPERRVCVFTCELPDGWWGGGGRILRLPDIYEIVGEERATAQHVLAARFKEEAEKLLATAGDEGRGDLVPTVVQQRKVPEAILSLSTMAPPDYVDLFTVATGGTTGQSPERWAHAGLEDAAGRKGQFVWRVLLGLRLEQRTSPDRVAGWKIADRGDNWLRLEAESWFLTAHVVFQVDGGQLSVATFIRYDSSIAAFIWPPLSAGHRRAMPGLLRHAVRALSTCSRR